MEKLAEVEEAKTLLTVAKDWSILKWLTEKKRVRAVADRGTAALDERERVIKSRWTNERRNAYATLWPAVSEEDDPFAAADLEFSRQQAGGIPPELLAVAERVKNADEIATKARLCAEDTFDRAERQMSASLARQGAEEALEAYELRYIALEEAEKALS
jgi:hypothetical protein